MNDKKAFVIPEAEILDFNNEDIITLSDNGLATWDDGTQETF